MMAFDEMRAQAHDFLARAFAELERNQFALEEHWHIDHLCYRTSTPETYSSTKRRFEEFSELLIESEVNGRLISTFKLPSPIVFNEWEIDLIEVPAPKAGKATADGFEHFEVVCGLTFDELKNRYRQCRFNESGLAKDLNQELEASFNGFALKFHPLSLESVINVEGNPTAFSALKKSDILKILKPFGPLMAGTFPLKLDVAGSDLDLLVSTDDFGPVKRILSDQFGDSPGFQCGETVVQGEPTLLISFSYQEMDFDIFGQRTPSIKQTGYLHFLLEERLLKIGGNPFAQKIQAARKQGLKTEPAFAKVLGLKGDPFEELLKLHKQSNRALKALVTSSLGR